MTRKEALEHLAARTKEYGNSYPTKSILTYQYWAQVRKIVDADTIDLSISLGFDATINQRTRLIGVNTPEVHGVKHDSDEYKRGKAASDFVRARIPEESWVEVKIYAGKREKYGRWLCEIFKDGDSINADLLENGHAVPF